MKMNTNILRAGILGITIGLAASQALPAAENATDFTAEQKQIEEEDAREKAEREKGIKGKYQRVFYGTVHLLTQAGGEISPDVVGHFVTDKEDLRPGRAYQMKLREESQPLIDRIKKLDGKSARLSGKLRLIGDNGVAKYVIVFAIEQSRPTPTVPERRSASGL